VLFPGKPVRGRHPLGRENDGRTVRANLAIWESFYFPRGDQHSIPIPLLKLGEHMKIDWVVKVILSVIAVSLSAIALRPFVVPPAVMAQPGEARAVYVEPGTAALRAPDGSRQVIGKVMVDLRNGNVWGFPTLSPDPYPATGTQTTPQTSHPFLLGKFAMADMDK
jgi:hypothetical protein